MNYQWITPVVVVLCAAATMLGFYLITRADRSEVRRWALEDQARTRKELAESQKIVSDTLAQDGHKVGKKLDTIETLVNSRFSILLHQNAALLREKANKSGDPHDEKLAVIAEQAAADHDSQQRKVDNAQAVDKK